MPAGCSAHPSRPDRARRSSRPAAAAARAIRRSASRSAAAAGGIPSSAAVASTRAVVPKISRGLGPGPLEVEAVQLVGDLDHPAGVHAVVRRVEDAALGQQLLDAGVGELVVGAAADQPAPQQRPRPRRSSAAAERARRVDVQVGAHQRLGVGDHLDRRVRRPDGRRPPPRDTSVTTTRGAVLDQVPDQVPADLADPGDAHACGRRSVGAPQRCSAPARMPWNTPYAVRTDESPAPPLLRGPPGREPGRPRARRPCPRRRCRRRRR